MRTDGTIGAGGAGAGRGRIVAGVLAIAGAAVLGFMTVSQPGTVPAWAAVTGAAPGTPVSEQAFEPVDVVVPVPSALVPGDDLPRGVLTRGVGPGELLMASAVSGETAAQPRVTLAVPVEQVPLDLVPGDVVDVWAPDGSGAPRPLLNAVAVAGVSDPADSTQVSVSLAVADTLTADAVSAMAADEVFLVLRGPS